MPTQEEFAAALARLPDHQAFVANLPQSRQIGGEPSALERTIAPLTFLERVGAAAYMHYRRPEQSFQEYRDQWVDWTDVVEYEIPEVPDAVKMGLSFALAVGLDPLTWTGIGGLTKAGRAAQATSRTFAALRKTLDPQTGEMVEQTVQVPFRYMKKSEQANAGLRGLYTLRIPFTAAEWVPGGSQGQLQQAATAFYKAMEATGETLKKTPGVGNLIQQGKRAFVSRTGSLVGDDMLRFAENTGQAEAGELIQRTSNARKNIARMARRKGMTREQEAAIVANAALHVETVGRKAAGVVNTDIGKYAVDQLNDIRSNLQQVEKRFGVDVPQYGDDVTEAYLPHVATREGVDFLNQSSLLKSGSGVMEYSARHRSMLERELRMPVQEANDRMRKRYKIDFDFFRTDPFEAMIARAGSAGRAIRDKKFVDDMLEHLRGQRQLVTLKMGGQYVKDQRRWRLLGAGERSGKAVDGLTVARSMLKGKKGRIGAYIPGESLAKWQVRHSDDMPALADLGQETFTDARRLIHEVTGAADDVQTRFFNAMAGDEIYLMPDEIAGELGRLKNVMGDDEAVEGFFKMFDGVQNWWKGWTLGIFPAYHFRNMVDDTWRNSLAGINPWSADPFVGRASRQAYAKAFDIMRDLRAADGDVSTKGMLKMLGLRGGSGEREIRSINKAHQAYVKGAMDRGVINMRNVGMDELPDSILNPFLSSDVGQLQRWVGLENPILGYANRLGAYRENSWRLAHYNFKVMEGIRDASRSLGRNVSLDDVMAGRVDLPTHVMQRVMDNAAISVKRTMFNPKELTRFEEKTMKRLFPFYSFFRNNLPYQLTKLSEQPGRFAAIDKARRSWESTQPDGSDPRAMSDWMKKQYPVYFGKDPDTGIEKYANMMGWISSMDLLRFLSPDRMMNEAWGMLSPIPKEMTAQFMNYDLFFRQAIIDYPGQTTQVGPVEMNARLAHVLNNIRLITEAEKLLFEGGELGLPLQSRVARFLTGFRLYPNDPVRGMQYYEYNLGNVMSEYKSELRKLQRLRDSGRISDRYYRNNAERLIRLLEEAARRPVELPTVRGR